MYLSLTSSVFRILRPLYSMCKMFFLFCFIHVQQVILTNNSEGFKAWLSPQAPVFIDFYFFNITNNEQFTANWSVRPTVKQIGPYVYREVRNKSDIEFSNHGRNLRFRQNKWYIFERNMSCGDENDTFTTVNLPLLVNSLFSCFCNCNHVLCRLFVYIHSLFTQIISNCCLTYAVLTFYFVH